MKTYLLGLVLIASCTSSKDPYIAGFAPPPPAKGYTRFVAPEVTDVMPGDDVTFCQWLADPSDVDRQVANTMGYQSPGGHHIVLYATTVIEKVGTSRPCTTQDMLSISFLGGAGGEGGESATQIPEGLAFSLPKGMAIMANTHYLNATDASLDAQSVADVEFADPKNPLSPVGLYALNWDQFTIPAGQAYTGDAYCKADQTLHVFMWSNHMHEYGTGAKSEIIHTDGTTTVLSQNDSWSKELAFNPSWTHWDPSSPLVIQAGDKLHMQCTWNNTSGGDLLFPREMCDGVGLVLEAIPQSSCEATATGG